MGELGGRGLRLTWKLSFPQDLECEAQELRVFEMSHLVLETYGPFLASRELQPHEAPHQS